MPSNMFKPSSKYFTDRSKAILLLWIIFTVPRRYFFCRSLFFICVLCMSCILVSSLQPCGHQLGKGWPLGSLCLIFSCVFVAILCGVIFVCIDSRALPSSLLWWLVLTAIYSLSLLWVFGNCFYHFFKVKSYAVYTRLAICMI